MDSSLLAPCHNRLDDVACLEAVVSLLLREGFAPRQAMAVHELALPRAMARGCNHEHFLIFPAVDCLHI